jgi:hypothetical protein
MECVKNPSCNCEKGCKEYPDTHECCVQKGNEGRLGIPVLKGSCDRNKGIPVKGCKDQNNKFVPSESYENFTIISREEFGRNQNDCNCSNWNNAFMVLFVIITILLFIIASWYLSSAKIR